jgi:hypothetical protein
MDYIIKPRVIIVTRRVWFWNVRPWDTWVIRRGICGLIRPLVVNRIGRRGI